jgi:hypothetical protein
MEVETPEFTFNLKTKRQYSPQGSLCFFGITSPFHQSKLSKFRSAKIF